MSLTRQEKDDGHAESSSAPCNRSDGLRVRYRPENSVAGNAADVLRAGADSMRGLIDHAKMASHRRDRIYDGRLGSFPSSTSI
jgi:hypothetical protein